MLGVSAVRKDDRERREQMRGEERPQWQEVVSAEAHLKNTARAAWIRVQLW